MLSIYIYTDAPKRLRVLDVYDLTCPRLRYFTRTVLVRSAYPQLYPPPRIGVKDSFGADRALLIVSVGSEDRQVYYVPPSDFVPYLASANALSLPPSLWLSRSVRQDLRIVCRSTAVVFRSSTTSRHLFLPPTTQSMNRNLRSYQDDRSAT